MAEETNRTIRYLLIALTIILAALIVFFVFQYFSLRRAQIMSTREMFLSALRRHHGPLGVNDIPAIRSWMTFDYINKLFALPPDYLKTQLNVTDGRYPRITIGASVTQVEDAIRAYLTTGPGAPQKNTSST